MKASVLLIALSAMSAPGLAQICPASNAPVMGGIGDGCTTMNAEFVFPHIGIFRSAFTPACDRHDKCYTLLGVSYDECDAQFLGDARSRCDSEYPAWLLPSVNVSCKATANEYYAAIYLYRSQHPEGPLSLQYEALARSREMQARVDADVCGTTPERTTIYASSLIVRINNAFLSLAARGPTLYEFFEAINSGDYVGDTAGWDAQLYTRASLAAAIQPPGVGYVLSNTMGSVTFAATPAVPGVDYLWRTPEAGSGPTVRFNYGRARWDRTLNYSGFLKATDFTGVRNLALIVDSVTLPGTCGPAPGPLIQCQ